MSHFIFVRLCWLLLFLTPLLSWAQKPVTLQADVYSCDDKETRISLPRNLAPALLDSLISRFDLGDLDIPLLYSEGRLSERMLAEGWKLERFDRKHIVISKPHPDEELPQYTGHQPGQPLIPWEDRMLFTDHFIEHNFNPYFYYPTAPYGINKFKESGVSILPDGRSRFFLKNQQQAQKVYVSGSFNGWSTGLNPMQKVKGGWEIILPLAAGKHLYKFIVDGRWMSDPANLQQEKDGFRGQNSVYYVFNKRFEFDGMPKAKQVYLTGSFNGWREKELPLSKQADLWVIDLYLNEGTHAYRFKADKRWYLDHNNPVSLTDAAGNENSYTSVGDTLFFYLEGFENAREVVVSGNFNLWNTKELPMSRVAKGWRMPYVLGPGVYEYKFIVDGQWIPDPAARYQVGRDPYENSILLVKPNKQFRLKGFEDAKEIILSGSFNGWNEHDFKLTRDAQGWYIDFYLPYGKHTYKFKVDGEWIRDPENLLWEQNEFGTGNSVVWMFPGK